MNTISGIELNRMPPFRSLNDSVLLFKIKNGYYKFNYKNSNFQKYVVVSDFGENSDLCDATGNVAYTLENNLYIKKPTC
ncbi:MAG: hypothetical protein R2771_09925 [Saprospiraceae bacterium]